MYRFRQVLSMMAEFNVSEHDRETFEYILDNIPDSITIVDVSCRIIFFNKTAEEYYGMPKSEVVGRDLRDYFPNALLPKVLELGNSYYNIYNSPRENSYIVLSALPLKNGDGDIVGALARDRDITEVVKLSDMLNKTQTSLMELEKEYKVAIGDSYFSKIISNNASFIQTVNLCKNISKTPINVLLRGESGTGKELFAKAIHYESGRKGQFIPINCSAIPEELFESELFGYEPGAFTGARREGKPGKFEEAEDGTLFLDEIGDMPVNLQPKLLRILEDGVVTRIGGNKPKQINVRIISATNRDIRELINENKFRKDLYYRLDAFQITIPPLRERIGDIVLLSNKFLQEFCMEQGINLIEIPKDVLDIFSAYSWEGNVRELRNVIQRAVIFAAQSKSGKIEKEFLPSYMQDIEPDSMQGMFEMNHIGDNGAGLDDYVSRFERMLISKALKESGGNKAVAAKKLQVPRTTLYYKMQKYGLDK